jgi:hypothetical protein
MVNGLADWPRGSSLPPASGGAWHPVTKLHKLAVSKTAAHVATDECRPRILKRVRALENMFVPFCWPSNRIDKCFRSVRMTAGRVKVALEKSQFCDGGHPGKLGRPGWAGRDLRRVDPCGVAGSPRAQKGGGEETCPQVEPAECLLRPRGGARGPAGFEDPPPKRASASDSAPPPSPCFRMEREKNPRFAWAAAT